MAHCWTRSHHLARPRLYRQGERDCVAVRHCDGVERPKPSPAARDFAPWEASSEVDSRRPLCVPARHQSIREL
ncbi:hypothetical protein N7532_002903 [Penicillium argentinense]|uniref:Uncharacterized protein n=1 Tax=Penicillium argentinense TaxID=1131581 RepID=A0A9W9G1B3_9EURO|nr:uncharacterized protein N7532_002903 [Penicillium argentinense]KAJ5110258.1 hypothetical protein N7532_002903 [Penicillium argentinense]